METIYVLWLRQVKKYFRSTSRIIGSIAQPLLLLIAFGYGFGSIYQKAGGGNYINFLAPGIILMSVLTTAMFSGIDIIWDRQFGFLKETLVAPVSRMQIVLGKTLGAATVAIFQGIIVFLLSLIIGFRPQSALSILPAFGFSFLVAVLFSSLGTAIASLLKDMQGFQLIMNFLVMPIQFLSGAFFPLVGLPKAIEIFARINPLTYGVDGLRGALSGTYVYGASFDFLVLAIVTTVLLFTGSYLFSKIQI
jgi:ABC-2 type transport system permease protein